MNEPWNQPFDSPADGGDLPLAGLLAELLAGDASGNKAGDAEPVESLLIPESPDEVPESPGVKQELPLAVVLGLEPAATPGSTVAQAAESEAVEFETQKPEIAQSESAEAKIAGPQIADVPEPVATVEPADGEKLPAATVTAAEGAAPAAPIEAIEALPESAEAVLADEPAPESEETPQIAAFDTASVDFVLVDTEMPGVPAPSAEPIEATLNERAPAIPVLDTGVFDLLPQEGEFGEEVQATTEPEYADFAVEPETPPVAPLTEEVVEAATLEVAEAPLETAFVPQRESAAEPQAVPAEPLPLPLVDLGTLLVTIDAEIGATPVAAVSSVEDAAHTYERFVAFRLGDTSLALHMATVREVERVGRVTSVPGGPDFLCGLTNLRGEILPLLDLRVLLGQAPTVSASSGRLVVTQPDPAEPPFALLVDELGGVALVDPSTVETELDGLSAGLAHHVLGAASHRGRRVLLLDPRTLLAAANQEEAVPA